VTIPTTCRSKSSWSNSSGYAFLCHVDNAPQVEDTIGPCAMTMSMNHVHVHVHVHVCATVSTPTVVPTCCSQVLMGMRAHNLKKQGPKLQFNMHSHQVLAMDGGAAGPQRARRDSRGAG